MDPLEWVHICDAHGMLVHTLSSAATGWMLWRRYRLVEPRKKAFAPRPTNLGLTLNVI